MKKSTIHIKLVTPLMLGSTDARKLDTNEWIRPTAIRGMLRFWYRAIAPAETIEELKKGEEKLFGGTGEIAGQRFKIIPPIISDSQTKKIKLFPHKPAGNQQSPTDMQISESEVELSFLTSFKKDSEKRKFQSILWLWLFLGSIGKRSRRGYGSLLWLPRKDDFLYDFCAYHPKVHLENTKRLSGYLMTGLHNSLNVWGLKNSEQRQKSTYFKLTSKDQIFVGTEIGTGNMNDFDDDENGIQVKMHGLNQNKRLIGSDNILRNEDKELGFAGGNNRLASQMIWRFIPVQNYYIPVMTWSPRFHTNLTQGTNMYNYLTKSLGFKQSLAGNPL